MMLEDGTDYCTEKMCILLKYMADSTVLTLDQITMVWNPNNAHLTILHFPYFQGFTRVFNDMTEIVLDVPNAYHLLGKFVERCLEGGFLSSVIAEQLPQR